MYKFIIGCLICVLELKTSGSQLATDCSSRNMTVVLANTVGYGLPLATLASNQNQIGQTSFCRPQG